MRTLPDTAAPDPHDYATARRRAEQERSEAIDDFWRGADAAWARVQLTAAERAARSHQRLQVRLVRRAVA
jgi:3',5'-cyclic AMP phosphodiesterase CpdA